MKGNFTKSIDVSETVLNLNPAVNGSRGTNEVAYTSMWSMFGAMLSAEIVIYKKYPNSMRLNFFDHRTLFWSPNPQF